MANLPAGLAKYETALRKIRAIGTFWAAEQTDHHLQAIRAFEIEFARDLMPPSGRLLELGAGSGWQAQKLSQCGFEVSAVDVPDTNYKEQQIWPVTEYDGRTLPFADNEFDIIFSSNVLEHIAHIDDMLDELARVINKGGCLVTVVPSGSWRFWTSITHVLRVWSVPLPHGEHASNALSEMTTFSRKYWEQVLTRNGWQTRKYVPLPLFYTGLSVLDSRLSISWRHRISRYIGGSCHVFISDPPD